MKPNLTSVSCACKPPALCVKSAKPFGFADKIEMTPDGNTYVASGSWDLLGGGSGAVSMVPGDGIGPNVYPFDSVDWPGPLEFMAEAAISVALGRQSAIAEVHGLYRMIQPESSVEELRELIAVPPPHIERVLRQLLLTSLPHSSL